MFKYCVKMAKDIVKILSSDDSRIILVFFELNCILKFLQALNTGGYKKKCYKKSQSRKWYGLET